GIRHSAFGIRHSALTITPRSTRLIRTADLQAFQHAIVRLVPSDPDAARGCAVIVPTRSAAEQLGEIGAEVVTRDEFYDRLRLRLPGSPPAASPFDREVRLRRAAEEARAGGAEPPFNPRAGLIREVLALYDELRRRHRTVADFDRLMSGSLESSAEHDRGAARLLAQTRFLTATFEAFERPAASAGLDEHQVRARVLASDRPLYTSVVVTVADQAAEARGLWSADFDLLARLPFLETIEIVATEAVLASGFYQRLHERELPGIEDVLFERPAAHAPILVVPDGNDDGRAFVCRDREEELVEFARYVKADSRGLTSDRRAIVFQRPLPYLYLARIVFEEAEIPYQALDSLPLAGEPFAAVVDLIFSAIGADYTRGALVELLRSPHFRFEAAGRALTAEDVHAFDRQLVARKYLGGVDRLSALPDQEGAARSLECSRAAADIARELDAAASAHDSPAQIDGILAFIRVHERLPDASDPWYERHMRARGAVVGALEMLRDAHASNDPAPLSIGELSGAVRRWIEEQTFAPRTGHDGIQLLDASAAAYARVDEVRLVGLTEADWPERSARSIFYPQSLLTQLGWPSERERLAASRARFQDLLRLARRRVSLSTITLEDDAIVSASPLLEDVGALGLSVERLVVAYEGSGGSNGSTRSAGSGSERFRGSAAEWFELRAARRFDDPRFRGAAGERAPIAYAVSKLERYLECPFKYFAAHVLKLEEERTEEAWLTPRERGHFVHEVFEDFFAEWQRAGRRAIDTRNVGDAMELFDAVAERHLDALPEGDRALERTLLLGSAAAAGFGERAFAFELEDGVPVVERLLEFELRDTFSFAADGVTRDVAVRSKADRIDLLEDGTLRVIDYKLSRAPDRKRALQLPIYGVCAQQALNGRRGRTWTLAHAGYIAFKEKSPYIELQPLDKALADGQARFLSTLSAIEAGEFPVQPDEPFLCTWCAFSGVCRKDYVGDE
ncbi:MAG TPA: PD-(D/E)XK nuclease family protein, partial [Vicinamibacterales bacterium]|nr:PD-(D/E)XK nuclease family protein [Vicinamibacterales bacterium]